jgi:hypothetical protein
VQNNQGTNPYDEFLQRKVALARLSMRHLRSRPNDEVEAEFAARRARNFHKPANSLAK